MPQEKIDALVSGCEEIFCDALMNWPSKAGLHYTGTGAKIIEGAEKLQKMHAFRPDIREKVLKLIESGELSKKGGDSSLRFSLDGMAASYLKIFYGKDSEIALRQTPLPYDRERINKLIQEFYSKNSG